MYRKLLLRFVLSKIDQTNDNASQIVKSVSVLTAIRWVAQAWESVKGETIKKCFSKSGITGSSFSVVGRVYENEDPFEDVEDQEELQSLVDQISPSATNCPVEEYIGGEDDVPTCIQYLTMTGRTICSLNLVPHKKTLNLFPKKIWMKKRDSLI